ncbi:MbcA/ParS/Xre antitoxin family protein [Aquabacterium sp.]|uniref:MbcA/ParS/Xre antitoxin family protein n=1 Tax=Aquabacterium sp. TaxID=1872578 RepID=UPI003412BD2C
MNNTQPTPDAELQSLAAEVFTGPETATQWLSRPHELFGGLSPREVARASDEGAERVRDMLVAIKYGGAV